MRSTFDFWPYLCLDCDKRFYGKHRFPRRDAAEKKGREKPKEKPMAKPKVENAEGEGPRMAYKKDEVRPLAKIVVEAENEAQMEAILLSLSKAVSLHAGRAKEYSGSRPRG